MKYVEPRPFADLEAAARKLLEIANGFEPYFDNRIIVGRLNQAFLDAGGTPAQYSAGLQRAIDKGWLVKHLSGSFVKFTQAGADLFA